MKSANPSSHWAKAGVFAAVAASLCCIAPVLTLLAGIGGLASAFSWLEPARPFLVGVSVVALGLAWYQQLKPKHAETDCVCEPAKPSFWQSKSFLGAVTVFAALMLAFPYYAQVFYPSAEKRTEIANPTFVHTVTLDIEGMTCAGCEGHVNLELGKIPGVVESTTSYNAGNTIVKFDPTKTNVDAIRQAVKNAGYEPQGVVMTAAYPSENVRSIAVSPESVTFYYTPLVCGAASHIGCGSRSKPLLLDLEQQSGIEGAWLNRAGTVLAVVWKNGYATEKERQQIAKTLFQKHDVEFEPVTKSAEISDLLTDIKNGTWYKGKQVDQLSLEEAGVIAETVVQTLVEAKQLDQKQAAEMRGEVETYFRGELVELRSKAELYSESLQMEWRDTIRRIGEQYVGTGNMPEIQWRSTNDKKCSEKSCCKPDATKSCCKQ